MSPPASEDFSEEYEGYDPSEHEFNLGLMLIIALAAIIGTTLTVWAVHFMQMHEARILAATTPASLPRIAILPMHSLSNSPADIQADHELTESLLQALGRVSRVQELRDGTDADPVAVGHELGVPILLLGRVERLGGQVRVTIQVVSARDGRQLWTKGFTGDSTHGQQLCQQIELAVAPHLTALLD